MGPTRSDGVAAGDRAAVTLQPPGGPRAPGAASGPRSDPSTAGVDRASVEASLGFHAADRAGDREQIDRIVSQLNDMLSAVNNRIRFSVSDAGGPVQVVVVDRDTGEVVKKIPTDRAIQAGANLDELVGLTVDETR